MAQKPHLNIVFIGHVDHGKSTTVGRLLVDTGVIRKEEIEKFRIEAEAKGKATFEFAWVMDDLKEERERGVTIDIAHRRFDTQKYYFTIIDAPGHRDFVKNMITGTSQADAAVLVVSAADGIQEQTREHIFLSRTLGVAQIICAINKMDRQEVKYAEAKYNEVKEELTKLLKNVGFKIDQQVVFLPISAFKDDNIDKPSPNMTWYKGPTLLAALDNLKVPDKPTGKPLRLPIQDVYTITGIGTVPVGRVETGKLQVGAKIIFMPGGKVGEVKTIEMHHETVAEAIPGDNVGFNVRGIDKNDIRRGEVAGPASDPPTVVESFTANIQVLNHPSVITAGYTPVFHCHTAQVACEFTELIKRLDPKTGQSAEDNPQTLKTGDAALVRITPKRPLVIEKYKEFPQLGRFAVRDMGQTVAAGVVVDVKKREG
ncbi:MAG: translation elongation factor EF-1 subunit alpha [Thermoplasmata archaeon]|nr:translation elongation factor EF-1 subunit alpha [Thermoplasmata archaeon]MCI4333467.1 translation elongation factor EF-1 subunit alpha [Thermoplasmata archaeon]